MKVLSKTELSNLKVVDNTEECGIRKEDQELVILLIQEALNQLYARFDLKKDSIYVDLVEGKIKYKISSEHLMTESLEANYDQYLWKPGNRPFNDDILKITGVVDSTGIELPLNNPDKPNSIFTPTYNEIEVKELDPEIELEVIYISKHPTLSIEENTLIEIPLSLYPAVRAYVASQVHSSMNTETAVQNAQKYLNQFNLIIAENIENGIPLPKHEDRTCRFILGGWV